MNEGKVIQVMGPVVDVEFSEGELPEILTALNITNPTIDDTEDNLVVEVAQHLGRFRFGMHDQDPLRQCLRHQAGCRFGRG